MVWVLGISCFIELAALGLMLSGRYNLWLYNAYLLVQFRLVAWGMHSMGMSVGLKRGCWLLVAMRTGVWFFEWMNKPFSGEIYTMTSLIDSMMITFLCFIQLVALSNREQTPVYRLPWFWIALAFVVFHGTTLPLNGLLAYLTEHDMELASRLYVIHDILFVLFFAVMTFVFGWMVPRQATAAAHD